MGRGRLFVLGHFFCDLGKQLPLVGAEFADDRDKPLARRVVGIVHHDAHKLRDLLIPRQLLPHFALAGAEPMLIDVEFSADQFNKRLVRCGFLPFKICNHPARRAEPFCKIGLRQACAPADILDPIIDRHRITSLDYIIHGCDVLSIQKE